jgi:uncharacterized protein
LAAVYPFLPLTIVSILTVLAWRIQPALRPAWIVVGLVTILCSLGDLYLLARLPRLGLSFGPVKPPFFMLAILRLLPFPLALAMIAASTASWQRIGVVSAMAAFHVIFLWMVYQGMYIEPFHLTTSEVDIEEAPVFFPGRSLRILQLSDLHIEHITIREKQIMEAANRLAPDMIVMTGDYINKSFIDDPAALLEARQWLTQLHAPYGVYAVNGNWDSPELMRTIFDGLENIQVLDDEVAPISFPNGTLYLLGASVAENDRRSMSLDGLMAKVPPDGYTLLLYHYPDRADIAADHGVDVFLAGDTHGGQVRLPWLGSIAAPRWRNPFILGRYQVGETSLYVSRGLGMQGGIWPRLRYNCPPELVLINLGE